MVGPARPSVLEKVDEVLRGHRCEAAVRVGGRAGVARVLWEGQGVTARAGREASSEVTRHSLKCTWTPPHRYVDSKQELGTRGCSAGRVSLPVHGAQVALSQGAGRSLRFPPPHPQPRPGHAALSPGGGSGSTLELLWALPTHGHPRAQHHTPWQKHPGLTCVSRQNSLRTWGPVRPVSGDRTAPPPTQPSLHPWSNGSSRDPDGGQVGRAVTRQQRLQPHWSSPRQGTRTDAGIEEVPRVIKQGGSPGGGGGGEQ